jgi:hypothetical protein
MAKEMLDCLPQRPALGAASRERQRPAPLGAGRCDELGGWLDGHHVGEVAGQLVELGLAGQRYRLEHRLRGG